MNASAVTARIAGWQPSRPVPPQAACFAREVAAAVAPAGRDRAKCLLRAAPGLASRAIPLGPGPVPGVLPRPSVTGRFAVSAPGLPGAADPAREPAFPRPRRRPAPGSRRCAAAAPAREEALHGSRGRRLPGVSRRPAHGGAALAGSRPGLPGRRRGADPVRPAPGPRHRRRAALRRGDRGGARGAGAADSAGASPLPRPAAVSGSVRRGELPGRRHRPRTRQHHQPADPVPGRRHRPAAAGFLAAARHLAGRVRADPRPAPHSCAPPGSPAASSPATSPPGRVPGSHADAVILLGGRAR